MLVFHDATCSLCDRCDCMFCFDTLERHPRSVICFLAVKHDCQSSQPPWNEIKMRDSDLSIVEKESMKRKKKNNMY